MSFHGETTHSKMSAFFLWLSIDFAGLKNIFGQCMAGQDDWPDKFLLCLVSFEPDWSENKKKVNLSLWNFPLIS